MHITHVDQSNPNWPSKTGNPSGGGRGNNTPTRGKYLCIRIRPVSTPKYPEIEAQQLAFKQKQSNLGFRIVV